MTEDATVKRKVLVLAPSLKSIGGVQNYTATLVSALRIILGSERVRLICVAEDPKPKSDGSVSLSSFVKLRFFLSALAAAVWWRPDLVICAHVGLATTGRAIQRLTRAPYWLVLYGIEVWGDLPPAKKRALQGAQCFLTITRFTLEATAERHNLHEPCCVLLPPSLSASPPAATADERVPPPPAGPIVLTVGRMSASEQYKGHDVMLAAWPLVLQRVPEAVYWIVGGGDDRQRLEARARALGIADSVRFLGSVTPEELNVCYDRCRVFAMPAQTELDSAAPRGEGFGIVFLEAMACGKPVVGPKFGAPAEFVHSDEHGLLVTPTDPKEVARAIVELLEDPARASRMGAAAREWVMREFSFDRFCERLRDALRH
ncbi:MAG TPA: glycosyltransferase family 4 protein [Candidatus Acidoferrales bacterium]|nr:glycosyltransferase family 4 protein [Candidatus Acidoferrales bacterium]